MAKGILPGPLGSHLGLHDHRDWPAHGYEGQHHASHSVQNAPGPIGSAAWHESVAHQQRQNAPPKDPYSVEDLKDRARTSIPSIGGRLQAWNQSRGAPASWAGTLKFGASAADRNSIYSSAWQQLSPDRGRYWFQAASMVTGRGGIKDMEGWVTQNLASGLSKMDLSFVKASDLQFVIAGNQFLYPYNLHNFFYLRDRHDVPGFEHFRGVDLDRGLVVLEQSLVQNFIDSYPWPDGAERAGSLARLSRGFFSSIASDWVKETLLRAFRVPFDFGNLDSRIRLGFALIARLRDGS